MSEEHRSSLSDQIKVAERDKLLAEAKKTEAERIKIEFDHEEARKASRNWFRGESGKKLIVTALTSVLIGLPLLAFYINYAVIPYLEHDKKILIRQNDTILDTIERKQKKLIEEEKELQKQKEFINSQKFMITQQTAKLKHVEHITDSIVDLNKNLALNSQRIRSNAGKYLQQIQFIQQKIQEQAIILDSLTSDSYRFPKFLHVGDDMGLFIVHATFNGKYLYGIKYNFFDAESRQLMFSNKTKLYEFGWVYPTKYLVTIDDPNYEAIDKNIFL